LQPIEMVQITLLIIYFAKWKYMVPVPPSNIAPSRISRSDQWAVWEQIRPFWNIVCYHRRCLANPALPVVVFVDDDNWPYFPAAFKRLNV
jgi:hypothetical protein